MWKFRKMTLSPVEQQSGSVLSTSQHCLKQNCLCFILSLAETMGFVDKLFECLATKNYLGIPSEKDVPKEEVKPVVVKSDAVEVKVRRIDRYYLSSHKY